MIKTVDWNDTTKFEMSAYLQKSKVAVKTKFKMAYCLQKSKMALKTRLKISGYFSFTRHLEFW